MFKIQDSKYKMVELISKIWFKVLLIKKINIIFNKYLILNLMK